MLLERNSSHGFLILQARVARREQSRKAARARFALHVYFAITAHTNAARSTMVFIFEFHILFSTTALD